MNANLTTDNIKDNRKAIADTAKTLLDMISSNEIKSQDCPVTHRFTPGCYLREIFMPKGTVIIGKIHATEHFNIVLKGDVTVLTAEGKERIKAPYTFTSLAGVQKVVIVHEDCVWQTTHVTDSTDLDVIEKEVITEDYSKLKVDGLLSKYKEELLCLGD